jgi:hypothetical protein
MSFLQVSKTTKALFLGFFCCLGVASANEAPAVKAVPAQLFSLNEVHPKSDVLVPEIENGTAQVPPGYWLCKFPVLGNSGKLEGHKSLLVSIRSIVTAEHVQLARQTGNHGEIAVLLPDAGGKRVSNATKKMQIGRDRLAVILEGDGLIAPTIQASLGREFVINGLDSKEEVARVVLAFNAPSKGSK